MQTDLSSQYRDLQRLLNEERLRCDHLAALVHIMHVMASSLSIDEIFETFAICMDQLVHHEAISITLLTQDERFLERFALASVTHIAPHTGERQQIEETVAGLVVKSGETVWSNNMPADTRFHGANDLHWIAEGFHSFISVPLRVKGKVIGSLNVLTRTPDSYFAADVATVEQVAEVIASFIGNMYMHAHVRQLAVAEERNRIAREIHDTLVQSLTSILLQLEASEYDSQDDVLHARLRTVREVARRALNEARSSIWDLLPSTLEHQPLPQAIQDELANWQQISGVPTRLFVRGESMLSLTIEVALLRILQEALHNAHKYARAHEVRVELEYGEKDVCLLISDDGVGFDPQQRCATSVTSSGLGIATMRERAQAAGGEFIIRSWPGNGTRLEVRLPREAKTTRLPASSNPNMPAARVLVVDDHTLIRQGLIELIRRIEGLEVVGAASDGYEALSMAKELRPNLILMDMGMPGIDGAATTRQLLVEQPGLHVIMLTASDAGEDIERAVEAGARGYILKETSVEQLATMIRAVLRGEAVIEQRITHHLVERFNHLLQDRQRGDALSERELEVLRLLVEGRRNREIASMLVVSEHTVKSHISNIFHKLGVTDRASAISIALQRNLQGLSLRHD